MGAGGAAANEERAPWSHGGLRADNVFQCRAGWARIGGVALPGRAAETEEGLLEEKTSNSETPKMSRSHCQTRNVFKVC